MLSVSRGERAREFLAVDYVVIRAVFFGNEQLAQGLSRTITPCFDALIGAGIEVVAVVTHMEETRSRNWREP